MRATVMPTAGDVRIENIPDAAIQQPTDAVIRITRACICGSDLWPYNEGPNVEGQRMGHEAIGVVEDVGSEVQRIRRGQVVIMPFTDSDGTCVFCEEGLPTACVHAAFFGNGTGLDGAQEVLGIVVVEAEVMEAQVEAGLVQKPENGFFAVDRRNRGDADIHFPAVHLDRESAVLGLAALGLRQHLAREVDADDAPSRPRRLNGERARARADVEHVRAGLRPDELERVLRVERELVP